MSINKTKPFRTNNLIPVQAKILVYEIRTIVYCHNRIYNNILIVIGSLQACLSRNPRAIIWVSNYRYPIWTFCDWIPVIGYPRDSHVNYVHFNGFFRNVSHIFQSFWILAQKKFLKDIFLIPNLLQIRLNNNYSMSPGYIWSDKITNERVARVGYNHVISNKGEWNNCFSKFSNRVLPPIFISTIFQSVRKELTTSGHTRPAPAITWSLHNKKLNESDSYANDNLSSTCGENQARII